VSATEEYWQERCDDLNTALGHAIEELTNLRDQLSKSREEIYRLKSMLSRIQVAMSQGTEL
jgi:archaellum component FlaC